MKGFTAALALAMPALAASAQNAAPRQVGLAESVQAAISSNLTVKLAAAQDGAIRAKIIQSAAALLPSVLGTVSQTRTFKENINALMGMGGEVGPFNTFDMRAQITQSLLDISSIQRYKAAKTGLEYSAVAQELAREQVAAAAALAYIEAARARKTVGAAQADHDLASALLDLASHQHDNGLATGLDVARAKTRFSDAKVVLLNAQSAERQAAIRLKRVAGWQLGLEIALKDDIAGDAPALDPLETLLTAAGSRPDVRLCRARADIAAAMLSAQKSSRLPVISASGNYGLSGNQADAGAIPTSGIGAYLSVPLFTGGAITGRIAEAKSDYDSAAAQLADMRVKAEEDVRLSYEIMRETLAEAALAQETVSLAESELAMSRDRYSQGVGDNIEVVTAQAELAKARAGHISALARLQQARVNLAAALGRARSFSLS